MVAMSERKTIGVANFCKDTIMLPHMFPDSNLGTEKEQTEKMTEL